MSRRSDGEYHGPALEDSGLQIPTQAQMHILREAVEAAAKGYRAWLNRACFALALLIICGAALYIRSVQYQAALAEINRLRVELHACRAR